MYILEPFSSTTIRWIFSANILRITAVSFVSIETVFSWKFWTLVRGCLRHRLPAWNCIRLVCGLSRESGFWAPSWFWSFGKGSPTFRVPSRWRGFLLRRACACRISRYGPRPVSQRSCWKSLFKKEILRVWFSTRHRTANRVKRIASANENSRVHLTVMRSQISSS